MSQSFRRENSSKLLIPYVVVGDPDLATTARYLKKAAELGVFAVELGIPFSDPTADGPVIQDATHRALRHETSLGQVLLWLAALPAEEVPPVYLMTYFNLFHHLGIERFCREAQKTERVRGVVIPDLSFEDARDYRPIFRKYGIDLVGFVSPTTDLIRARKIVRASRGFVYYVGLLGTTGSALSVTSEAKAMVLRLKGWTSRPVFMGFGISEARIAEEVLEFSDGVIVGSRLVSEECSPGKWEALLTEFATAVNRANRGEGQTHGLAG